MATDETERLLIDEPELAETHYRTGLSTEQVEARLGTFGPNAVDESRNGPKILDVVWEEVREPMILLLLVVAVVYSALGTPLDALTIFATVALVVAVEVRTEYAAKTAIRRLTNTISYSYGVLRDSVRQYVPGRDLVPGDILFLMRGQRVPCDGMVLVALNFAVDESVITGESVPAAKSAAGALPSASADSAVPADEVLASTLVAAGSATVLVQRTGASTRQHADKIKMKKIKQPKTDLQKLMKGLAFQLSIVAAGVSVGVALLVYFIGGRNPKDAVLTGLALAFATIPEELPLIVKAVLAIGAFGLSKRRVLVRRLRAAEALGSVDTIVTDKTGTLTENRLTVQELLVPKGSDVVAVGSQDGASAKDLVTAWALTCDLASSNESDVPMPLLPDTFDEAIKSHLHLEDGFGATDLGRAALQSNSGFPNVVDYASFSAATRTSSVLRSSTDGAELVQVVKGAHESVLEACVGAGSLDPATAAALGAALDGKTSSGRLICYGIRRYASSASKDAREKVPYRFAGAVRFEDPVLHDAAASIGVLRRAGYRVLMATGDSIGTATAVAHAVGIHRGGRTVTGSQLAALGENDWDEVEVAARLRPEDKLDIVRELQDRGHRVLMVGDGDNDAMSLAAADAGVCIAGWSNKSDTAMDAASVVLLAADPADVGVPTGISLLLPAIREGKRARANVAKTVIFYLACKLSLVMLFIVALAVSGTVPLNPIQVIVLEALMDLGAGSTFTFEPVEGDPLAPRSRPSAASPIFNRAAYVHIVVGGLLLFISVGGTFGLAKELYPDSPCMHVSASFVAWLAGHVFWGLSCRTTVRPILIKTGIFSNPAFLVWAAVVLILGLVSFGVPIVRTQLGLCELPWEIASSAVASGFVFCFVKWEVLKWLHVLVAHVVRSREKRENGTESGAA
ncbi:hypothetical protein DFJ74DRAFT_679387 [Hyaloraphidium curvatum]|nr:hypothetical protein DFJ74DRAFT_679387 [Hyaloraphidium curvatum]